jgi:hypothetical protein
MEIEIKKPMTELHNGWSVETEFLNMLLDAVERRIPTLFPQEKYKLKNICGRDFWNRLDRNEQIIAGMCMVYLVQRYRVQMSFAGKTAYNSNLYQLA